MTTVQLTWVCMTCGYRRRSIMFLAGVEGHPDMLATERKRVCVEPLVPALTRDIELQSFIASAEEP